MVRLEATSFLMAKPKPEMRGLVSEECVVCSDFLQATCVCFSGFTECSYGNVVPGQFMTIYCCHALRTTLRIHKGPNIPGTKIYFVFSHFPTAEVDVQPAAVCWQERGEASIFLGPPFLGPFPGEGGAVHSLKRAAPSSRADAESPCLPRQG